MKTRGRTALLIQQSRSYLFGVAASIFEQTDRNWTRRAVEKHEINVTGCQVYKNSTKYYNELRYHCAEGLKVSPDYHEKQTKINGPNFPQWNPKQYYKMFTKTSAEPAYFGATKGWIISWKRSSKLKWSWSYEQRDRGESGQKWPRGWAWGTHSKARRCEEVGGGRERGLPFRLFPSPPPLIRSNSPGFENPR